HGVAKDLQAAFRFNLIACTQDDGYCGEAAASAARIGNEARAFELFERHCRAHKDWDTCAELGKRYAEGRGTKVDEAKAREAWKIACDDGDGDAYACGQIGVRMK